MAEDRDLPDDLRSLLEHLRRARADHGNESVLELRERLWQMAHRELPADDRLRLAMDSEDLAQDALLELVEAVERFRGTTWAEFFAFAQSVLRQKKVDLARHHGRQKRSPESIDFDASDHDNTVDDRTPSVILAADEDRKRLELLMTRLPELLRNALALRLQGLGYDRVAERLGIGQDNARQCVSRAVRQIKSMW